MAAGVVLVGLVSTGSGAAGPDVGTATGGNSTGELESSTGHSLI